LILQIGVWLTAWVKLRDVCVFTAPFFAGNTVRLQNSILTWTLLHRTLSGAPTLVESQA
jgi:hypothetical protein